MNYLAHLYFGRKSEASLVGNFLGDFVKGTEESLHELFPKNVVDGILMHRKIDKFTDENRFFAESKMLISSRLIRYAGIVIDIFMDHFLAKHWDQYGEGKLENFILHCHEVLLKHPDWHSETLKERLPQIIENELLLSYRKKEGIKNALESVSQRSKNSLAIADAYEDFERNYDEFEKIFHDFFPLVKNFANTLAPSADLKLIEDDKLSDEELIMTWRQHTIIMAEKQFRIEALVGFFKSKGVTQEAALRSSEQIMKEVNERLKKTRLILFIPGILTFLLAVFVLFLHKIFPHEYTGSFNRNAFCALMLTVTGLIIFFKAKAIR
jgi:acyl carrier protein phosphodiesterase